MKRATTTLVFCVLGLLAVGLVMLYSLGPANDGGRLLRRQLLAGGLGLAGALGLGLMDYRRLRAWSPWLVGVAFLMLVLVLVPGLGYKTNGARRWFRYGGFQFQPSDYAKLALLVALADYGAHWQRAMQGLKRGLWVPAKVIVPGLVLLFLEPDWGTALLMAGVSAIVLLVAGVRWTYLIPPVLLGALLVGALVARNPVRFARYYSWRHLEETKDGIGGQAWQARAALGNGGPWGVGLHNSTQKRFVPESTTDFIFAIFGEEFGYVGSVAALAAFAGLFLAGARIAAQAPDTFGLLLATGISFLVALQALLNVAVVSGALPNKGLPLPFVSYGGSNLMMMLCAVGVLVSIARQSTLTLEPGLPEPSAPTLTPIAG